MENLQQALEQCAGLYQRQIITANDFNSRAFDLFVDAIVSDTIQKAGIISQFDQLPETTKTYFEAKLRRLPCEGDFWDWPPGIVLRNPGGLVAWQTPPPEVQDAIAILRKRVAEYWSQHGQTRDLGPGGPVHYDRTQRTTKNLRRDLVLWAKGIVGPEYVMGPIFDCLNETELAQDWNACERCDRDRIRSLVTTYRPAKIPWCNSAPLDREWQAERERKYIALLRLLDLQLSQEWERAHALIPPA